MNQKINIIKMKKHQQHLHLQNIETQLNAENNNARL